MQTHHQLLLKASLDAFQVVNGKSEVDLYVVLILEFFDGYEAIVDLDDGSAIFIELDEIIRFCASFKFPVLLLIFIEILVCNSI